MISARITIAENHAASSAARRAARLQRPLFPATAQDAALQLRNMKSVPLTPHTLGSYDAVIIATDHSTYDYAAIADAAKAGH